MPIRPQSRYPRAPSEPGSTLFQPQLHSPIGRYTSAYIRKPKCDANETFLLSDSKNLLFLPPKCQKCPKLSKIVLRFEKKNGRKYEVTFATFCKKQQIKKKIKQIIV
jgi:hypothetical protein